MRYKPVGLFAELASAHIVDGAQAELVRARWDEASDGDPRGRRFNIGEEHGPRRI